MSVKRTIQREHWLIVMEEGRPVMVAYSDGRSECVEIPRAQFAQFIEDCIELRRACNVLPVEEDNALVARGRPMTMREVLERAGFSEDRQAGNQAAAMSTHNKAGR